MTLLLSLVVRLLPCIAAVWGANQRLAVVLEARLNFSVWITELFVAVHDEQLDDEIVMVSTKRPSRFEQSDEFHIFVAPIGVRKLVALLAHAHVHRFIQSQIVISFICTVCLLQE